MEKQGPQLKSVELWFYIITWSHPKMVSTRAGRPPPPLATPLSSVVSTGTARGDYEDQFHSPFSKCTIPQKLFIR